MKKRFKRALAVVITAVMILTAAPLSGFVGLNFDWLDFSTKSSALASSGQCGANVYWTFDESTGTLTISGTGAMYDYVYYEADSYHDGTYYSEPYGDSPFYQDPLNVKTVIIQNGVTNIGNNAFYNCRIESVTIPESITCIGYNAFASCTQMNKADISSIESWLNITFIGSNSNPLVCAHNLYLNGEPVTDLIIPGTITSINDYAFSGCRNIKNITVPESITSIGYNAFYSCLGLERVNISSLESWCRISFASASSNPLASAHDLYLNGELVTDLIIPSNITIIKNYAFCGCRSFLDLTIHDGVETIGEGAFLYSHGFNEITIPDSVVSIGDSAFYNCAFMIVEIPENVETIGHSAFYNSYCDPYDPFILKVYSKNCTIYNDSVEYSNINPDPDYPLENTGLIVYGYAYSTAYQYAVDNELTFRYLYDEHEHTYTDDCDTTCNICGAARTVTHEQYRYIIAQSADGSHTEYKCSNCGRLITDCWQFGENVFGYRTDDYTWFFFGSGAMYNYTENEENPSPFNGDFGSLKINEVVFEEGITYIGDFLIYYRSANKATIPSTLESISSCAFRWSNLGTIAYAEGTETINLNFLVFDNAPYCIYIPSSAKEITGVTEYGINYIVYYDGSEYDWPKITGHELLDKYQINYTGSVKPVSVSVTKMPDKTTYHVNSNFDPTGMEITIQLADGTICIDDSYSLSYTFSSVGQKQVTISYDNISTAITVEVVEHFLEYHTTQPTCIMAGEEYAFCTECGTKIVLNTLPALPHSLTGKTVEYASTCTQTGCVYDKCSMCGQDILVSVLPLAPHTYERFEQPATCRNTGRIYDVCSVCGDEVTISEQPIVSHNIVHFKQECTCTVSGIEYDHCTMCDLKFNEVVFPAAGHRFTHIVQYTDCVSPGEECDICSVCNEKINVVEIPAKGHTLTHVSIAKTCTVDGEEYDVCSVCNGVFNHTVNKTTGHSFKSITVSPTCTQIGMRFDYCLVCGEQENLEYLPAAHMWGEWRETGSSGDTLTLAHTCSKCSAEETKTVSNVFTGCKVTDGRLTGLTPGMTPESFRNTFITDPSVEISDDQLNDKIGTGYVLTVYYDEDTAVDFECVIFGDVDGDGIYDGQDAMLVNCLANGLLTREQVGEAKYLAADCNHDGEVNASDALILEQAGLLLSQVDQSNEDYAETDACAEYLNLIDQNPQPQEIPVSFIAKIVEIIKTIVSFIRSLIVR